MKRSLIIEFTKMNGAGNDFVILDNRFYQFSNSELSSLALEICPRRTGIGADGILALADAEDQDADYRMIYINADGSEGTMCGNGARCLAKFAFQSGIRKSIACMETASGMSEVHVHGDGPVRVYLNAPTDYNGEFALNHQVPDQIKSVHYLWPGTEHLVCFTSDLHEFPIDQWGGLFRNDPALAPSGANINFVQLDSDPEGVYLRVRTYEKGVESETLACGTGAVASVVAARTSGFIRADECRVHMPGGILMVGIEGDRVYLEGATEIVYRGSMEPKNL